MLKLTLYAIAAEAIRAVPVIGPVLRRLDKLEAYVFMHEAELDYLRAVGRRAAEEKACADRMVNL